MEIIYEDKNLLVINKLSGLIVHPKHPKDVGPSVAGWLLKKYPEIRNVGENLLRPGIVHRLDRETSGLLLIAKNNDSFFYLKNLFQERKIKKYYLALVWGRPKKESGLINAPLGKIGIRQTTRISGKKELKERAAATEYRTIKKFQDFTLLEVAPKTGRTHQIRIHLKFIGHPVAGDKIYGFAKNKLTAESPRLFLHAYKLEFTTPDGKSLVLETGLPEDLQNFISALK